MGRTSWHDVKQLKFSKCHHNDLTQGDIEQVLIRCGYFLTTLEIWDKCYSSVMLSIRENCPNLNKLIVQFDAWNSEHLVGAFSTMKNLQKIKFDLGGRFNYLSTPYYFADQLIREISLVKSLRHVEIDHRTNLKNSIDCLLNLRNLEYLDVQQLDQVDDKFLAGLSRCCKNIQDLNISGCKKVTDLGLCEIAKLKYLTNLRIKFIPHIKDTLLGEFKNLKNISCVGCGSINDISIKKLLQNSKNLERLYLRETSITVDTLVFANGLTRYRTNNIILNLFVNRSLINAFEKMKKKPSKFINISCELDMQDFFF